MKHITISIVTAVSLLSSPAQASCWNANQVEAIKLRHLDVMLMVTALRCRNSQHNYLPEYNQFVTKNRTILAKANIIIRNHYYNEMPKKHALNEYDRLVVTMANNYGTGHHQYNCQQLSEFAKSLSEKLNDRKMLLEMSDKLTAKLSMKKQTCPIRIAKVP